MEQSNAFLEVLQRRAPVWICFHEPIAKEIASNYVIDARKHATVLKPSKQSPIAQNVLQKYGLFAQKRKCKKRIYYLIGKNSAQIGSSWTPLDALENKAMDAAYLEDPSDRISVPVQTYSPQYTQPARKRGRKSLSRAEKQQKENEKLQRQLDDTIDESTTTIDNLHQALQEKDEELQEKDEELRRRLDESNNKRRAVTRAYQNKLENSYLTNTELRQRIKVLDDELTQHQLARQESERSERRATAAIARSQKENEELEEKAARATVEAARATREADIANEMVASANEVAGLANETAAGAEEMAVTRQTRDGGEGRPRRTGRSSSPSGKQKLVICANHRGKRSELTNHYDLKWGS